MTFPLKSFFNSSPKGLIFTIPGAPVSQKRATPFMQGKKIGMFDPQKKLKKSVGLCIHQQFKQAVLSKNQEIFKNAVYFESAEFYIIRVWFYYPIAVNETLVSRNAKLWGLTPCIQKPDLDNLEKFYLDAATGILFPDDCLINQLASKKTFDKNPRTEMQVIPCKKINLHPTAEKIITIFDPDRLKEFLSDVEKFSEINVEDLDNMQTDCQRHWFMATASMLAGFFKKYNAEVKKIAKHFDYEYNPFDIESITL